MTSLRTGWLAAALVVLAGCGHDVAPTPDFSDPAALPVPQRLTLVQQEDGSLYLEWEEDDAVFAIIDGWDLYRAHYDGALADAVFTRITAEPWLFRNYTDRDVEDRGKYAYFLRSVSPAGVESLPSPTIALTIDRVPPSAPTNLTGAGRQLGPDDGCPVGFVCAEARLSWDAPPETDVAGYRISREPAFILGAPVDWPYRSFLDSDVEPGATYRYTVAAVDYNGNESAPSEAVDVFIAPR